MLQTSMNPLIQSDSLNQSIFFHEIKKKSGMKEYTVFDNILIKYTEKLDSL